MKTLRRVAMAVVVTIALASIVGSFLPRFDYARQDREHVSEASSRQHWLGTDDLGRDRFSRLLHGTRLSLVLAPAAAALSLLLALAVGATTGFAGGLPARAFRLCEAQFILLARATGVSRCRLLWQHLFPNLKPVLLAQFWIAVPVFILSEANLSLLGLGVSEPLPSLGSMLREMETVFTLSGDACRFAALILLVVIMSSLQIAVAQWEVQ